MKRGSKRNPLLDDQLAVEPLENRNYLSPIVFTQPTFYPTGTYPDAITTADLTGNGKLDVITADYGSGTVAVLRGNGDGTLQAPVFYQVGSQPESIASGDLNGDGFPDIVVANENSSTISVLMGNGDGTLQNQVTYQTGLHPEAVAVADLTGNGLLDIVTANEGSNDISVFMNQGNGLFAPAINTFAGLAPDGLAIGDLNGDEQPDIVTVNPVNSNLHVLLNQGNGLFKLTGTYDTGAEARAVGIADMNADGRPDVITANLHGASISLLLNDGNGTLQGHQEFGTAAFPFSINVADINGDGRPDVIAANNYDNSVGVLVRDGKGSFGSVRTFHAGDSPVAVAVADLNGDGKPDIIAVDFNTDNVAVLLNQTKFTPLISTSITLTPQLNPVLANGRLILTAHVTPSSHAKTVPIGVVQFFDGDSVVGIGHVSSTGIARAIVHIPQGNSMLTAHYSGDGIYGGVLSTVLIEQALPAAATVPLLVPTVTGTRFPEVFLPGDKGSVSLTITNQDAGTARGSVDVELFATTDGKVDSSSIPLFTEQSSVPVALIGGQARSATIDFTFQSGTFEPGLYTVMAVLTPGKGLTAGDVSSTAVTAGQSVGAFLAFGTFYGHVHYVLDRVEQDSVVKFTMTGPGYGTIVENSDGSINVMVAGTSTASKLAITTTSEIVPSGGHAAVDSGSVQFESFTSSGVIGSIFAPTATALGAFSAAGVRNLTLAGASNAVITLGSGLPTVLSLGTVNASALNSTEPIRSLIVAGWTNTSADEITAPYIEQLTSAGNFGPAISLSGSGAPGRQSIGLAVIHGSIGDDVWNVGSSIGTLQVASIPAGWSGSIKGTLASLIDTGDFDGQLAALSIGSIVIDGNMNTANVLAGADFGGDGRLGNDDDFFGSGSIASLRVLGSITGSVIAAGLKPDTDEGILLDAGTTLQAGKIPSVFVTGTVDATTKILAKTFPATVSIDGSDVTTAGDVRFGL